MDEKLQAIFDWAQSEIDGMNKWEEDNPQLNNGQWWPRKNQMLKVKCVVFDLMAKDIYPSDTADVAYCKHAIWVLTQRANRLLERIEKTEDETDLKELKSIRNRYKRNITRHKKHLNHLMKQNGGVNNVLDAIIDEFEEDGEDDT